MASPALQYRDPRGELTEVRVNPQKGEWNLRNTNGPGDLQFMEGGKVDGFAVVKFERVDNRAVGTFLDKFKSFAQQRGSIRTSAPTPGLPIPTISFFAFVRRIS